MTTLQTLQLMLDHSAKSREELEARMARIRAIKHSTTMSTPILPFKTKSK